MWILFLDNAWNRQLMSLLTKKKKYKNMSESSRSNCFFAPRNLSTLASGLPWNKGIRKGLFRSNMSSKCLLNGLKWENWEQRWSYCTQHACLLTSRRWGGESGGGRERKDITLTPSKVLDREKTLGMKCRFRNSFKDKSSFVRTVLGTFLIVFLLVFRGKNIR